MSMINPKKVAFETEKDVIDYVSRGLPPTKKNYREFINRVRCPLADLDDGTYNDMVGNTVIIEESLFLNCDKDTLERSLERVYENRRRNRNIALAAIGIVAGVLIIGATRSEKKDRSEVSDSGKGASIDMSPDNFPEVDV